MNRISLFLLPLALLLPSSLLAQTAYKDKSAIAGVDVTVFNADAAALTGLSVTSDKKTITLKTLKASYKPSATGAKLLYLHRLISNNAASVCVKVDISKLIDANSGIGLMSHSSLANDGSYCKLYVKKSGAVMYETKSMGSNVQTSEIIGTMKTGSKSLLLKMCMANGRVYFQIAHNNYTDDQIKADSPVQWLTVSNGFMLPSTHFYGFFMSPGESANDNSGLFTNFNIQKLEGLPGGLGKTRGFWTALGTVAFFVLCPVTAITVTTTLTATAAAGITVIAGLATGLAGIAIPVAATGGAVYTVYSTVNTADRILQDVFKIGLVDLLEKIDPTLQTYTYDDPLRKYFVAKTADPAKFKDLPFVNELKTAFVASPTKTTIDGRSLTTGTYPGNSNLTELFSGIQRLSAATALAPFTQSDINAAAKESDKLSMTVYNLEVYTADAIHSYITGNPRAYTYDKFALYLQYANYDLLFNALAAIGYCKNAGMPNVKDIFSLSPSSRLVSLYQCASATDEVYKTGAEAITNDLMGDLDPIIQASARAILHLSFLSFVDSDFYLNYNSQVTDFVRKATIYAMRMEAAYSYNNIPMKVLSSASLYYSAHGNDYVASQLNDLLNDKFSSEGGYAEGTNYLEWLGKELFPYYYVATKNGWNTNANPVVARSGKWLIDVADRDGVVPALDDANCAVAWLAPFAYLNSDSRYKDYPNVIPRATSIAKPIAPDYVSTEAVVRFLTYPVQSSFQTTQPFSPQRIVASNGIAKINTVVADTTIGFSMLYEDGQLLSEGGSHDQQDGGSVSLRRKVGAAGGDTLVIDPGYGGYGFYKSGDPDALSQKLFKFHNTPQIDAYSNGGVTTNSPIMLSEILEAADGALDLQLGATARAISTLSLEYTFRNGTLKCGRGVTDLPLPSLGFSGAGGGTTSLTQQLTNGFQCRINYDFNGDYANRTVQTKDNDFIILDEINSSQRNFSVFYNLPPSSIKVTEIGQNVVFGLAPSQNSSVRVSVFSGNGLVSADCNQSRGYYGGTSDAGHPAVRATRTRFSVSGTPPSGSGCTFVSVIEPRPGNFSKLSSSYLSTVVPGARVALVKDMPELNKVRYILVNLSTNGGAPATMTVRGMVTDARFVVVDFARNRTAIQGIQATSGTFVKYFGKSIAANFSTGEFAASQEMKNVNITPILNLLLD